MKISNKPLIKWTGSKRFQAKAIVDLFPKKIDTYYECFLGGGSVLHELLNRIAEGKIQCNKIVCCDINKDLIDIFNIFLKDRKSLFDYYCTQRAELVRRSEFDEEHEKIFTREHVLKCQTLYYENREKYIICTVLDCYTTYSSEILLLERGLVSDYYVLQRTFYKKN